MKARALAGDPVALQALRDAGFFKDRSSNINAASEKKSATIWPLSYHQERLWFINRFESGRVYPAQPVYHNVPLLIHVQGNLNPRAAQAGLNKLIERHPVLRSRVRERAGQGAVEIIPARSFMAVPRVVEMKWPGGQDVEEWATDTAIQQASLPLVLERECLRALYLTTPSGPNFLLLVTHHMFVDRESLGVLARDWTSFYANANASVAPTQFGYDAFARWQRNLPRNLVSDSVKFWAAKLGKTPPLLELPLKRARDAVHVYDLGRVKADLKSESFPGLAGDAERPRELLAGTLAVWSLLLYAYTRRRSVVIGVTATLRDLLPIQDTVGPFANLLPLLLRANDAESFSQHLASVTLSLQEAWSRRTLPFELLSQQLRPAKDMTRTVLFDTAVDVEGQLIAPTQSGDAACQIRPLGIGFGKYDIFLQVQRQPGGARVNFIYNRRLIDDRLATQMCEHFVSLCEIVGEQPWTPLARLSGVPCDDRPVAPTRPNATSDGRASGVTGHEAFALQVAARADAIAVVDTRGQVSFGELDRQANAIAWRLHDAGVKQAESVVALHAAPSADAVAAMIGVWKAGGAYLPIDDAMPVDRMPLLLERSGACWLLHEGLALSKMPAQIKLLPLHSDANRAARRRRAPYADVPSSAAAYCIFTSGSTGTPKGVLIEHRNLTRLILGDDPTLAFTATDVWTLFHSISFDFSVWEIYGALLSGGRLVIVPPHVTRDPTSFIDVLEQQQVTILNQTPTAFKTIARLADRAASRSVRYVIFGGEALEPSILQDWRSRWPSTAMVNMYGITETTIHVTAKELSATDIDGNVNDIGRAISGVSYHVLDDRLERLPIWVQGEIGVGGQGVGRGYVNEPCLTAERFIPDPYAGEAGSRLYRSGDLARRVPEGRTEYRGRADRQVKVRGFRIELDEVEGAIRRCPGIKEAAVLTRALPDGHTQLVAAYSAEDRSSPPASSEVRNLLQERLPGHMIPSVLCHLAEFPRTSGGKIDRPALASTLSDERREQVLTPHNPVEASLITIWRQVLRRPDISTNDNFFAVGGDSILSIQVVMRANDAGLPITAAQVFQHQTIAELAAAVLTTTHRRSSSPESQSEPEARSHRPMKPSPIQQWFLGLKIDHLGYTQAVVLQPTPSQPPLTLATALDVLMRRHDAFGLIVSCGGSESKIKPSTERNAFTSCWIDCSGVSPMLSDALLKRVSYRTRFDLEAGSLARSAVFRFGPQRYQVLVVIHHLAVDAWSWRVLAEQLRKLAVPKVLASPVPADAGVDTMEQWVRRLPSTVTRFQEQLPYWIDTAQKARNAVRLRLEGAESEPSGAVTRLLTKAQTQKFCARWGGEGTSIEASLLAAVTWALHKQTGATVVLDVESHGRPPIEGSPDLAQAVGWFTSLFPVAFTPDAGSPEAVMRSVREAWTRVPDKGVGFGVLRYFGDTASRSPLAGLRPRQVRFNYLGRSNTDADIRAISRPPGGDPTLGPAGHVLDVSCSLSDEALRMTWSYPKGTLTRQAVDGLSQDALEFVISVSQDVVADQAVAGGNVQKQHDDQGAESYDDVGEYPLTPLQQGMLFNALASPDRRLYVIQTVYRVDGPLDLPVFAAAVDEQFVRHDILRTSFPGLQSEVPTQRVWRTVNTPMRVEDWRNRPGLPDRELSDLLERDFELGFDVTVPPLARLTVVRTAALEHRLIWTLHHLITDGWSGQLLLRDLWSAYNRRLNVTDERSRPAPSFGRYAREIAVRGAEEDEQFWRKALADWPRPSKVRARARPASPEAGLIVSSSRYQIDEAQTQRFRAAARLINEPFSTLIFGAWALCLAHQTQTRDVTFGVTVSGRHAATPGIVDLVGPLINTLPLRVRLDEQQDWLKCVGRSMAQILDREHCSLSAVRRWARLPTQEPLFQSLVVFENYPTATGKPAGLHIAVERYRILEEYPLVLEVGMSDAGLRVDMRVHETALGGHEATQLLDLFGWLLGQLGNTPTAAPAELLRSADVRWRSAQQSTASSYRSRAAAHFANLRPAGGTDGDQGAPKAGGPL